jgi:hypothetical protein
VSAPPKADTLNLQALYCGGGPGDGYCMAVLGVVDASDPLYNGVPQSWLVAHGFTNDFLLATTLDQDHDGLLTWAEYVAGTVPTSRGSLLEITGVEAVVADTSTELRWQSASNRRYSVMWRTNLFQGGWSVLATNLPAAPPENTFTNAEHGNLGKCYYVIEVERGH